VQPPRARSGTLQVDELLDDWGEGVVFLENGHVAYFTFAVIDVAKDSEKGNDGHGSKIIVVPFDGRSMDRDLNRP
jgi:hypothetical protein